VLGISRITTILLPHYLGTFAGNCLGVSCLVWLDLSITAVESVCSSFCRSSWELRELRLPPTLKKIGDDFLCGSPSMERVDLSGTALESVGVWF
jgi:hypothetical protein